MLSAFLLGSCSSCEKVVLTARDLKDDELVDRCIHCDTLLPSEKLRWAAPSEVVSLGYFIDGYRDPEEATERGCRGGSCGVQQRKEPLNQQL